MDTDMVTRLEWEIQDKINQMVQRQITKLEGRMHNLEKEMFTEMKPELEKLRKG